jgi:hypothetical protein
MSNANDAFTKQFTRVHGGYIVQSWGNKGGRFVSEGEYEQLVIKWKRTNSWQGKLIIISVFVGTIAVWTFLYPLLSAPEWINTFGLIIIACLMVLWFLWAFTAPQRLVRGRPSVTPSTSGAEARREARASFNWLAVFFAFLLSGLILFAGITATERDFGTWMELVFGGAFFMMTLYIALMKLIDRRR